MSYRVEIPPHVTNLILDQAIYIARESVDRAIAWTDEIQEKIKALGELPLACAIDSVASERVGHEVRRRAIGEYLVYYYVDQEKGVVVIEGFRHGARLPESS